MWVCCNPNWVAIIGSTALQYVHVFDFGIKRILCILMDRIIIMKTMKMKTACVAKICIE